MKSFNLFSLIFGFLLLFSVQSQASNPQKRDFYKTFNKTFDLKAADLVQISNRYGHVNVKTWAKNQVAYNVKVTVRAETEQEAQKTFNRININFSNGSGFVKGETIIAEASSNSWWGGWNSNSSCDFTIDYEVMMPASQALEVQNKYGNTALAALNSNVTVEQKYGNLTAAKVNNLNLNLAYGNSDVETANDIIASIAYGKLKTINSRNLELKTKYSGLTLGKVNNLKTTSSYDDYKVDNAQNITIDSRYGDFVIQNVDNITVKGDYTDFNVQTLDKNAEFVTTYGDVRFGKVSKDFQNISVKGSYTDVTILTDPAASFQIDASGSYSDIRNGVALKSSTKIERGQTKELRGVVGNANTKSNIKIRLSYGDLILK